MTAYYERDITVAILSALNEMPVVAVTGMRQTGKSTFLKMQKDLKGRAYYTFDDFAHLAAAKEDPDGFVESDEPMTIDEVQKCPEILTAIKRRVDRSKKRGQFLLSGSANLPMLSGISESLAGRAVYFTMHPFTRREIAEAISGESFLKRFFNVQHIPKDVDAAPITGEDVLQGGMPSVCLKEVNKRSIWFKGFEQTYLERDVRELSQIGNIIAFRQMLHLTALRSGQILSPSQIGRDAKLSSATTSRYLSLLEASFVIYRLNPYLKNRASRLIKSPKVYLSDSGIACHFAGIGDLNADPLRGHMFETYIAQNISGIIDSGWPEARLCYWNVQGRHEVDFIIESGKRCLAVEVKASSRWEERDISNLKAFLEATPHCIAAVLGYNGTKAVRLGERLWAIPLSLILS